MTKIVLCLIRYNVFKITVKILIHLPIFTMPAWNHLDKLFLVKLKGIMAIPAMCHVSLVSLFSSIQFLPSPHILFTKTLHLNDPIFPLTSHVSSLIRPNS